MTVLTTARLTLRPWRSADLDLLYLINHDERVMRLFPFRRTRAQAGALLEELIAAQMRDWPPTLRAIEITATSECIGFCGLHPADAGPFIGTDAIEIGWRLAADHWGKGFATEAAHAWLAHGFETLGLEEIVSYAVASNAPSIAVMRRLGMQPDSTCDFDHHRVPDSHPALKRHVVYTLTRNDWRAGPSA